MRRAAVPAQWLELDGFLAAFEAAQLRDGHADPADFLPAPDHPLYAAVLRELVRVDLEYGWDRGRPRRVEDYQQRFPALARDREGLRAVAFEEYRLRRRAGEGPSADDYRRRFGIDTADWPGARPRDRAAGLPEAGADFLDFHLVAELGRGAFSRVFLARQGALGGRHVALKVAADLAGETQTLVQLQHPHIVPVYSVHRAGRLQALCMPYLGATTLADVLHGLHGAGSLPQSGKELVRTLEAHKSVTRRADSPGAAAAPAPEAAPPAAYTATLRMLERLTHVQAALWIAARLADGLAHAHERGILHRDLKPANVLLTDGGLPMLLDFNLSADTKPRGGAPEAFLGGTLPYMAPEHLEAFRGGGRPVDERSDLYSLGVVLCELLTGRAPFPARRGPLADVLAGLIADRSGPAPDVRRANRAASPAVAAIVRRCLEPDPGRRYPSARDLREDLERQLNHLPLRHAPEPSPRERLGKWARRHPRLTSATTVGAVVAAAAALALWAVVGAFLLRERREAEGRARQEEQQALGRAREEERRDALEARDGLRQLGQDLRALPLLLGKPDAERNQREEGLALCRRAAARYGVLDTPSWEDGPLVRALDEDDRRRLREDLGELLLLWARAEAWRAAADGDPARRREQAEFPLRLNARAEACYGPGLAPRALWLQRARLAELAGDGAEAERLRARAEQVPLRTARDRYLLVLHQLDCGQAREALAYLHEASRRDPQDAAAWLVLGNCHAALGQPGPAAGCYDAAVALAPESPWAFFNRGLLHLDHGDAARALADFDQVLRLRPDLTEAAFNRALARLRLGRPAEALADLNHFLDHAGNPPTRAFFARAQVRALLKDAAGAARDRQEGLRREPTDDHDCVARGVARLPGDPRGALADFEKALTFNPLCRRALQNQAHVLAEYLGRPADAVRALDRLLELYPDSVPALAGRGVLHARLGRRDEAHRDARAALARDGGPATLYQAAGAYAQTSRQHADDRQEALRLLAAALHKGYGLDLVDKDRDLDPLRGLDEFRRLVEAARALPAAAGPQKP